MFRPKVPSEILKHWHQYNNPDDIPKEVFDRIKAGFEAQRTDNPLISVNIIAWNEEAFILRNLSSLSAMKSQYPVEFVFVDNNSTDRTSEIIRKCGLNPIMETTQGYGFARQTALENSKGKYIITGDADTAYLPTWIDTMVKPLIEGNFLGSYGTYSFVPQAGQARIRYAFYELFRDMMHHFRSIKRPELIVVGMNFCFPSKEALEIGFIKSGARMEDGKMALALLKRGKLTRVTDSKSIAWTGTRTVEQSGTLLQAGIARILKDAKRLSIFFYKKK